MNAQQLAKTLWGLLRPQTYILMVVYVVFGITYGIALQTAQSSPFTVHTLVVTLCSLAALALWYIAGAAFNDYADYEIDKINLKGDKQRPLVAGLVTKRQLLNIGIGTSVASAVCAVLTMTPAIALLFGVLLLFNVAYSLPPIKISHRGGLAPLILPLGYIILTVCSGMIIGKAPLNLASALVVAGMYVHFLSRIILKDHRDVKGDKKMGKKTLVLTYGNRPVVLVSLFLFVASAAVLAGSLWSFIVDSAVFFALFIGAAGTILYRLSEEERWKYQKPLITAFGRLCSGLIMLFIFCFIADYRSISNTNTNVVLMVITVVFFWSLLDIKRLQSPVQR